GPATGFKSVMRRDVAELLGRRLAFAFTLQSNIYCASRGARREARARFDRTTSDGARSTCSSRSSRFRIGLECGRALPGRMTRLARAKCIAQGICFGLFRLAASEAVAYAHRVRNQSEGVRDGEHHRRAVEEQRTLCCGRGGA